LPKMSEMIEKLNKALESIRPYLKEDGGDVEVLSLDEWGVVKIKMIGNCKTCLQRNSTIKTGIESVLKSQFPEIKEVIEG
jgi:Fe-S cluster biogenesis protein NfuA